MPRAPGMKTLLRSECLHGGGSGEHRPAQNLPDDHLAGATAGVELARRTLRENKGNAVGQYYQTFVPELEEDGPRWRPSSSRSGSRRTC
jgi:hypothetical protein